MATNAQDIPQDNLEDSQQEDLISDQPLEELEGTPPSLTPPSTGPTEPESVSAEYVRLLEEQLRQQNSQIQQLIDQQVIAPTEPPAPRDVEQERQQYYNDPIGATQQLIRQELENQIAPLKDFVTQFKMSNAYDDLKTRFKRNPMNRQLAQYLDDSQIASSVDEIMSKAEKNEQNLSAAIVHVLGLRAAGVLGAVPASHEPAPTPQPTPTNQGVPVAGTPAHLRPSTTPPPRQQQQQRRELNELERRLAREKWPNLTAAEQRDRYLNFLDARPNQVVNLDESGKVKQNG